MAHFAELDQNSVVTQVVVVHNDELLDNGVESEAKGINFLESLYGHRNWKQTSYNATIRRNYAGIGFSYDVERDAFIAPKPFDSWILEESTCRWSPPSPCPDDGNAYRWDEPTTAWVAINSEPQ